MTRPCSKTSCAPTTTGCCLDRDTAELFRAYFTRHRCLRSRLRNSTKSISPAPDVQVTRPSLRQRWLRIRYSILQLYPVPARRPRDIHAGTHARQEAGRNTVVIRDLGHGTPPHLCVHLLTTDWATRAGTRLLGYLFGRHVSILKPESPTSQRLAIRHDPSGQTEPKRLLYQTLRSSLHHVVRPASRGQHLQNGSGSIRRRYSCPASSETR